MTKVWAIADLHLSFGVPDKEMHLFGDKWRGHADKVASNWKQCVGDRDLVLVPGDISWAMTPDEAKKDLDWIHALPGTKVLLRGNHDFWWSSLSKAKKVLPPSMHLLQNDSFFYEDIAVAGARLWDSDEYHFSSYIDFQDNPRARQLTGEAPKNDREKIFERELQRLETSLKAMQAKIQPGQRRIAMTHYPPIGPDLAPSRASALMEKYGIEVCAFGHLHNVISGRLPFGERNGVKYVMTACDAVDFRPVAL